MDWQTRLIVLYLFINEAFKEELQAYSQRLSNNSNPQFSDQEVVVIYLWGLMQHRRTIKEIYNYCANHLSSWFPHLPSYEAYVMRLNRLEDIFVLLIEQIQQNFPADYFGNVRLIDSMPIILAKEKRSSKAKVAPELANKGYCGSQNYYYYGVKLHILAFKRSSALPLPEYIGLTPASNHDLSAFKQIIPYIQDTQIFADKAYIAELETQTLHQQNAQIHTPCKRKKNQEHLSFFQKLVSSSISRVRQPIESLFNWIQEKTNIQIASKVRSSKGLIVHVFGRMAAALFLLALDS